ncbi:MAG: hypothetical protein II794_02425, partial [Oscillospiraceae bacterium]|nr:hypothetical protein [Oscillospiraceae bacterium]
DVPFMHYTGAGKLIKGGDMTGVVLPYQDGKLAFAAFKPTSGTARELLEKHGLYELAVRASNASDVTVMLSMPKFTKEYTYEMTGTLSGLGLAPAMGAGADFTEMGTTKYGDGLVIDEVLQKVKIIVDEDGTEAAAVTQVTTRDGMAFFDSLAEVTLDSEFVYIVYDTQYGIPLFAGIMDDPA